MKKIIPLILLCAIVSIAHSQTTSRRINFKVIDKDSINLSMNENYRVTDDSCAQIVRHSRFNLETRKFYGKFTDVSKANPDIVLSEGFYTKEGLKNGAFIQKYLNGNLQAKGDFKDDKFDGKWEFFYSDGKPQLVFTVTEGVFNILDSWKPDGSKIIDNGNGTYKVDLEAFYWKGKLVNGKPDDVWKMYGYNDENNTVLAKEHFKKGEFIDGSNQFGDYRGVSRIILVNEFMLPFITVEKMYIAPPCNGAAPVIGHNVVSANYKGGDAAFHIDVRDAFYKYFIEMKLEGTDSRFSIKGDISADGKIINLRKNGSSIDPIAQGLISVIESLPRLNPATIDGKPVVQRIKISFDMANGSYSFSYQFLPLNH
jgi:hypothetical protein